MHRTKRPSSVWAFTSPTIDSLFNDLLSLNSRLVFYHHEIRKRTGVVKSHGEQAGTNRAVPALNGTWKVSLFDRSKRWRDHGNPSPYFLQRHLEGEGTIGRWPITSTRFDNSPKLFGLVPSDHLLFKIAGVAARGSVENALAPTRYRELSATPPKSSVPDWTALFLISQQWTTTSLFTLAPTSVA